ncbi:MAG: ABC transporter permease subunit [Myxococcota bacterium]
MSANQRGAATRRSMRGAFGVAFRVGATASASIVALGFAWIAATLLWRGIAAYEASRLGAGVSEYLAAAALGSLQVVAVAFLMAVPLGVAAGVYIGDVGRHSSLMPVVRSTAGALSGMPAVLAGVFVLFTLERMGWGQGWFAGSVALAILMTPMLACTTSRTLERLSPSLREAALVLGTPPWRILLQVSMRAAAPGILSAGMLALARASGQVAPLLVTVPARTQASASPGALTPTLHVDAYRLLLEPAQDPSLAWTAALLLALGTTTFVLVGHRLARRAR